MDTAVKTALSAVAKELSLQDDNECQQYFDEWSKKYDEHMKTAGSGWQAAVVSKFEKYTANMQVDEVLDLGAGTGEVAEMLRATAGYRGEMDIMDGSMEMLYLASKKNIGVRAIMQHFVKDRLPVRENAYDVVTCGGSFLPNHIPPTALPHILNVVKPGGLLIFNLRAQTTENYNIEFDAVAEKLLADGRMTLLEKTDEFPLYQNNSKKVNAIVFVYKRN